MRRKQSLFAVAFLSCATSLAAADTPSERMLDRLKGLAGTWEGTLEWSHGRTGTGPVKATYRRTGSGSAVVEDLAMGDGSEASMTSVYHLDGAELRMTHYCGARNQPRLKVSRIDEAAGIAEFSFVDITGSNAKGAHVQHVFIQLLDADRLHIRFDFGGGTGPSCWPRSSSPARRERAPARRTRRSTRSTRCASRPSRTFPSQSSWPAPIHHDASTSR
jgi:hypothetical protein